MQKTKVIFVPAEFQDIHREKTVKIPTGNTKKNFLGFVVDEKIKEKQVVAVGKSDCLVDGKILSEDVENAILTEAENGFKVVSIVPVTSGNWAYEKGSISGGGGSIGAHGGSVSNVSGSMGYSYGYSFTAGIMITFSKD